MLASLSPAAAEQARHYWPLWARPAQLPPQGDWRVWLIMAGRGFGKSRTGAEWVKEQATTIAGSRIALVGRSAADVRDVMVEGESGILAVSEPKNRPRYEPSKRRVTWPNGSLATCYSADKPDQLRGPQHSAAWCDEIAAWRYPDTWDQLMFGLRLGADPRVVATTTPRPVRLIRELVKDTVNVRVTRGSTIDNASNLPPKALAALLKKYKGTTLGRQELDAEVLDEMPGALWKRSLFDTEGFRVTKLPQLVRVVVGVDPATTAEEGSDETGIVAGGVDQKGDIYVLDDLSMRGKPAEWATAAVGLYRRRMADRLVAEKNQGGDMVEAVIRTVDKNISYTGVHAAKGKRARAEPIAALYEQGRVHHVGVFYDLEDQLCNYVPGVDDESPDRLDALVWALTELTEHSSNTALKLDLDANYVGSQWRP